MTLRPLEITDKMYEKILRDPLVFPDEVAPSARSILTGLLTRDPALRLGVNGAEEIKRHPFFEKIDWQRLAQKKIQPPFKPSVRSPVDVSNFDTVFTAEQPLDSVVEGSQLSQTVQAQFEGAHLLRSYHPSAELAFFLPRYRVLVQCTWPHCGCGLTDDLGFFFSFSFIHSSTRSPYQPLNWFPAHSSRTLDIFFLILPSLLITYRSLLSVVRTPAIP